MCRFYTQGRCFYASHECAFAHSPEELRSVPNLSKTSLCVKWSRGCCPLSSEECRYAHGCEELRRTTATSVKKKASDLPALSKLSAHTSHRKRADSSASTSSTLSTADGSECSELDTALSCIEETDEVNGPLVANLKGMHDVDDLLSLLSVNHVLAPPPGLEPVRAPPGLEKPTEPCSISPMWIPLPVA